MYLDVLIGYTRSLVSYPWVTQLVCSSWLSHFFSILSRTSWELLSPLIDPIHLFKSIAKYVLIGPRYYLSFEQFNWLISSNSTILYGQVKNFYYSDWFNWTVQGRLPYNPEKIMSISATAINIHSETPRHVPSLQTSSPQILEESTHIFSPYFMLSFNPSKDSSVFPS